MEISTNSLLAKLASEYSDRMCDGVENKTFSRGCIESAYIIGAASTLRRICLLVEGASGVKNGLTKAQCERLLTLICLTEGIRIK